MEDNKSLVKNSIYNVSYKLLNVFFPLISVTYVSHVLMASGVGMVASAQNITTYFVLVAALGIPNYGTREIAKLRDSVRERNKVFTELFLLNMLSTIVCTFIYYSWIFYSNMFNDEINLYIVIGLLIPFNIMNVDWFYQGTEEYKYIAFRSFAIKIIMLIALVFFVRTGKDYIVYALITVIATGGNYIFNVINLKKRDVHLTFNKLNIYIHLKPVFVLLCTTVAIELYTLLDTTMITFFCTSENVAYYGNSIKIVRILITVVSAIGGVLLPRLSYYQSMGRVEECSKVINNIFYIMLFIFIPCGVGVFLVADKIVPLLFGESFMPAVETLKIATLLIYTLGFSNLFGTQILLTFNKEKKLFICTIIGAVSNIAMNICLIPQFQQNGATVASVISELFVTIVSFYYASKIIKISFNAEIIIKSIISSIGMTVVIIIIKGLINNYCITLICCISMGAIIYLFLNIILKNPICVELVKMVVNRK